MSFLAWLLRSVLRYRTDVVTVNLSRSFPEKTYEEIQAIHKQFYQHLATVFKETLWFGRYTGEKERKRLKDSHIVELVNPEELNRLYDGARQVMLLQSHTGNWELVGGFLNYSYGEPLTVTSREFAVTYRQLSNRRVDAFMARNRTAAVADLNFEGYVETRNVVRFVLERKDQKYVYSFITDQFPYNANRKNFIHFMHRDTPTMTGAAELAVKLDMAVAYLRMECREGGGYRLEVVPISGHAGGEQPLELMQKYYQLLEADLEKQPWNYLWTHKRWKLQ